MSGGMCRRRQTAAWMSLRSSKKLFSAQIQAEEVLKQAVRLLLKTDNKAMYMEVIVTA